MSALRDDAGVPDYNGLPRHRGIGGNWTEAWRTEGQSAKSAGKVAPPIAEAYGIPHVRRLRALA